ncbi:hypothetical protein LJC47_05150 [Desulfosarcina sp. OttesenSCG-928-B08]|nr:hypothetical protein [Desulfosarcina sp. OttesenSCG-928-B08]
MYILDPSLFIGRGVNRECYRHPENSDLCIKVVVGHGGKRENRVEQSAYRRLEKRGISWEMLSRFYGTVNTNKGPGAVFELIRDKDGAISKPLRDYIGTPDVTALHRDGLSRAFFALKTYLIREEILTTALKAQNMVYQRTPETDGKLVIIDDIGNTDFIPICTYLGWAARRKINRKWAQFEHRLKTRYAHNPVLQEIISHHENGNKA